jgi:hypothetical protein
LLDVGGRHLHELTAFELRRQRNNAETHAHQPAHRQILRLEQAAHDAVATFP